ncbi:MAG: universal stress protein [Methanoregula sp.]|nr:universal stress protein [Methanoregula sp.]
MFEKIMLTTDFSAYAKKTLDCIAGFPKAREVILFHVAEEARSPRGGGEIGDTFSRTENNLLKEQKRYLENLSRDLRVTTAIKASSDTAGAIIDEAEKSGVSLIVIGARGNNLVDGIFLGSVSLAVLRRSRTSVLLMRHKIMEEMKGRAYDLFCPMILSRVLCPVDFSPFSERAITLLSGTTGVKKVILLHVVSRGETDTEIAERVKKAEGGIETIRRGLAVQGIEVKTIVRTGNPGSEIVTIADEEDASVIWMSSHGTGWFRELLLGSTAYTVSMNAKRPVIIIRTPEIKGMDPPFYPP